MLRHKFSLPITGAAFAVIISFIYSLSSTILTPVFPIFIKDLVNNEAYVGYFLSFIYFLVLTYILISTYFLKNNKITILKFSVFGFGITLILLAFVKTAFQLLFVEIFRALFIAVNFVVMGLLIRDASTKKTISSNEGYYFAIINISFFIGPIIGGLLADAYSLQKVFLISSIFSFLVFILLFTKKGHNNNKVTHVNLFANIKEFFGNKNLTLNYLISAGIMAWLAILYIYVPLYMAKNGLNEKTIGIFLALTVIPLIFMEIPVSRLTKYIGYRKIFFFGFFLMGLFGILSYFSHDIITKLVFLILTNFGIAFVEPLKEAYFFETNKRSNEIKYYPIFKTASDVGHLAGPLIFSTILLFTNFNIMFLSASILMVLFAFMSFLIKEVK